MVLINPNTATATTRMMTAIARRALAGTGLRVRGVTAAHGPAVLTTPTALRAAVPHVLTAAHQALASGDCAALIVAAFGDPGVSELRGAWPPVRLAAPPAGGAALAPPAGPDGPVPPPYGPAAPGRTDRLEGARSVSGLAVPGPVDRPDGARSSYGPAVPERMGRSDGARSVYGLAVPGPVDTPASGPSFGPASGPVAVPPVAVPVIAVPVVGIGEAALAEAAVGGRRFGIATTTPRLEGSLAAQVERLGLAASYTGARFTAGAPDRLAAHPDALLTALEAAVRACVVRDGAEAVVIGGGPLGDAATALQTRLAVPVIAPVPAACRRVAALLLAGAAPED
ncbi:aspartate/glutamate racemase family protein [Streptomyces sp. NPDC126499]|uniref:aspartate/glutamate racemase family protein n=1 Tax=Streptomyces sp. NPDC126499 TaxID=3155314 RepID=UPI003329F09E